MSVLPLPSRSLLRVIDDFGRNQNAQSKLCCTKGYFDVFRLNNIQDRVTKSEDPSVCFLLQKHRHERTVATLQFTMFVSIVAKLLVVLSIGNVCDAFLSPQTQAVRLNTSNVDASAVTVTSMNLAKQNEQDNISVKSRRSILSTIFNTAAATVGSSVFLPSQAFADAETMERGGVKLTPFNSLAFNYRGTYSLLCR